MTGQHSPLIWIDAEMTGLNPEEDVLIEIACIVTDNDLEVIAESPVFAIHQSDTVLAKMDEWNQTHHGRSGLITRVKQSITTETMAEQALLAFLSTYLEANKSSMCGNSICQDRRFLARYMPQLEAFFHYRNFDVSTVKEMFHRWYPEIAPFPKKNEHLAVTDIRESIAEMQYYRQHLKV